MHNDTCINIELSIVGDDFDIELVSKELDIEPTEIKKKGELLPNKKNRNIETSWSFMTGIEKSLDVRIQLCKLMDIFYKKIDKLKEICLYFNTKVFVSILIIVKNQQTPSLHFGKEEILFFNEINAELDIDIYIHDD